MSAPSPSGGDAPDGERAPDGDPDPRARFGRHDRAPRVSDALARRERAPRQGRARVLAAIGAMYVARLLVATIASYPLIASIDASGVGQFDVGAAKLFEPGGLYLLEWLVRERDGLVALMMPTAGLLLAGSLAGLVPEWLLLRALGRAESDPPTSVREPRRPLPRLVLLALASWVARGLLVFVAAALAATAQSYFVSARDERLPLVATAVASLLGLLGWACLSVLRDRAAIEISLEGATPLEALERALGLLRRRGLALISAYAGWTLAGVGALLLGTIAASAFDVSTGGSAPALAAATLHQLAVVAQIALRAAWLASAIAIDTRPSRQGMSRAPAQPDAFL